MTTRPENIFLGDSGRLSNAVAYAFYDCLPDLFQGSEVFISNEQIDKGQDWFPDRRKSRSPWDLN